MEGQPRFTHRGCSFSVLAEMGAGLRTFTHKNYTIMKLNIIAWLSFTTLLAHPLCAQDTHQKGTFVPQKPGYFQNSILKGIDDYQHQSVPKEAPSRAFKLDLTGVDYPKSLEEFTTVYRNNPISQGNTGTCWSYSTTSYFETEVYRLTKQKVKLSEAYTVYWEYVEKARRFVEERGNSHFDEGSEANAVIRTFKKYGAMPYDQYSGLLPGETYPNHSIMIKEMKDYLENIRSTNAWNEEGVLSTIKSILNHYMGTPPQQVTFQDKTMSPLDYVQNILRLNMDDYIDVISVMEQPYWQKVEYTVPDNWWHDTNYWNVPLDTFMRVVKSSIRAGYSMFVGGDVSESGFVSWNNVAMIPTYDIPSAYIDENAREFRFANGTTTDDHGMHLVGYKTDKNGKDWFLIKDSGSGSRNVGEGNPNFGYYFFQEDYVKLKIMYIVVHRDMMKNLLPLFKA